ncbi:MAG: hypothetical protein K2Y32_19560 [Candidatus Obscuribacterales bacterium]|nr:hypothetical protein [Candidatus Obscuribacterales bacterium]
MGLAIEINVLGQLLENGDEEGVAFFKEEFELVNKALKMHGLPEHVEPEELLEFDSLGSCLSFPYSFVHYLRTAMAYARNNRTQQQYLEDKPEGDENNELLQCELFEKTTSHIICHSDCEGYYLPLDFEDIIFADEDYQFAGGMLGSSKKVLEELLSCADFLGIVISPDGDVSKEPKLQESDNFETDSLFREFSWEVDLFYSSRHLRSHPAKMQSSLPSSNIGRID